MFVNSSSLSDSSFRSYPWYVKWSDGLYLISKNKDLIDGQIIYISVALELIDEYTQVKYVVLYLMENSYGSLFQKVILSSKWTMALSAAENNAVTDKKMQIPKGVRDGLIIRRKSIGRTKPTGKRN